MATTRCAGSDRTRFTRCGYSRSPVDFYGEVLQELVIALGGALFVANVFALMKRKSDRAAVPERTVARARPGSPVRGYRNTASSEYSTAPIARSVTYALIGLVVMIWGIASVFH